MQSNDNQTSTEGGVEPLEITVASGGSPACFTLTERGVVIKEDATYEEWHDGLALWKWMLRKATHGYTQYVGWGVAKFGRGAVENSLEQLEFDMPNVTMALDVSTVPEYARHENLTPAHYVVLARSGLGEAGLRKWSRIASEQLLGASQLKESINAGEVVNAGDSKSHKQGIISVHGLSQELVVWLKRVGGVKGILKLKPDVIAEIMGELSNFVEVYDQVQAGLKKKKAKKGKIVELPKPAEGADLQHAVS